MREQDGDDCGAFVVKETCEPEDPEGGDERAEEGADSDGEFVVTKEGGAAGDEPCDHRRMIEVSDVEMLRVEPVISFLGKQIGEGEKGEPEEDQTQDDDGTGLLTRGP